jgi:hypothetical protein
MGRVEAEFVLMVHGMRVFVEFNNGERVEAYDSLDAIRRLDRPGRITVLRDDTGRLETVGWWTDNGYERNPDFRQYGDDGVTPVMADDNL